MELRHLRYFIAVAEHLSFRKAADELCTSQPAVSTQIKALERELEIDLLVRSTRRVQLTDAGRFYLEEARRIVAELASANERARAFGRDRRTEFVLGGSSATTAACLPAFLSEFRARYPNIRLKMRPMPSVEVRAAVRNGTIDVGFVAAFTGDEMLESTVLWEHPFRVMVSVHHPAARMERIRLSDLGGERLIVYSRSRSATIHDEVTAICRETRFQPGEIEVAADITRTISLVACGSGIAVAPAYWEAVAGPGVVFREISPATHHRLRIAACWNRRDASAVVHNFVRMASRIAAKDRAPTSP